MTGPIARTDFEHLVVDWLDETAGAGAPTYLDETLARIDRVRQRPAWLSPGRWLPMRALTLRRFELPRYVPYVAVLGLLLVLALVAVFLIGSRPRLPAPFGLAATGLAVYDSDGDLFVVPAGGADPRPLTATPGRREFGAVFSRDGTQLAFAAVDAGQRAASLFVTSASGESARNVSGELSLATDGVGPIANWSPRSDRLVFEANGQLAIVDADGSNLRVIAKGLSVGSWPVWSPDGTLIAYHAAGGIYVVSPDGGNPVRVSQKASAAIDLEPVWSPDGTRLIYHVGGDADIVVATLRDGAWTESVLVGGSNVDSWPTWSNHGDRISFIRSIVSDHGHVMVANADGSGLRQIDSGTIGWAPHCWTPDDLRILAVSAELNKGIGEESSPGYVLLRVDGSEAPRPIPTLQRQAFAACSWQRLAP